MIPLALFLMQAPDGGDVPRGAKIFAQSCAVGYCHGTAGAANRGPRLAGRGFDKPYLEKTIRDGIPGTAMPAFKALQAADLNAVIAYVSKISGGGGAVAAGAPVFAPSAEPPKFPGPPDVKKGKDLFFDATRGVRCGTCHAVDEWGVAVGPNLAAKPPASVAAIRGVRQQEVRLATTKSNEKFPALLVESKAASVVVYDLTAAPPVLRTFHPSEIQLDPGGAWSHAGVTRSYSDAELTSIVSYVKWVASR